MSTDSLWDEVKARNGLSGDSLYLGVVKAILDDAEHRQRKKAPSWSSESRFRAASEAAENWVNTVGLVAHFGPSGAIDPLYEQLLPSGKDIGYNLRDSYHEHIEVLTTLWGKLAEVNTVGPVGLKHGLGWSGVARAPRAMYPERWLSRHEAAAGLARMTLEMLTEPLAGVPLAKQRATAKRLLAAKWKALAVPGDLLADLRAGVRDERMKLLRGRVFWQDGRTESDSGSSPEKPPAPKWDPDRRELKLNDTVLLRFGYAAPTQIAIIEAFEAKDWPAAAFPKNYSQIEVLRAASRLNESLTTKARNSGLTCTLQFRGDGTGELLCWEVLPL